MFCCRLQKKKEKKSKKSPLPPVLCCVLGRVPRLGLVAWRRKISCRVLFVVCRLGSSRPPPRPCGDRRFRCSDVSALSRGWKGRTPLATLGFYLHTQIALLSRRLETEVGETPRLRSPGGGGRAPEEGRRKRGLQACGIRHERPKQRVAEVLGVLATAAAPAGAPGEPRSAPAHR